MNYRILASHFFVGFQQFSGACNFTVYTMSNPNDKMEVLAPLEPPCSFEDFEDLISVTQNLLLIADRDAGLLIFDIQILLPGESYITIITNNLQDKYTIDQLFKFTYVRSLRLPRDVYKVEAKLLSSEHLVVLKGYSFPELFMVDVKDMNNPLLIRTFANVYD